MPRGPTAGRTSRIPSGPPSGRSSTGAWSTRGAAANPDLRRFTWWDYRAGNFQRNEGMRIDHLLASPPVAARVVAVEVDREARKGTPTPSDHAPLVLDLDEPGKPFDPGWAGSEARFAARRAAHKG